MITRGKEHTLGLSWYGSKRSPLAGPLRRRKGFPTWSWASLVNQIETGLSGFTNWVPSGRIEKIEVEDVTGQRLSFDEISRHAQRNHNFVMREYGKALIIKAPIVERVRLRECDGHSCIVYAQKRTPGLPAIELPEARAWIDEGVGSLPNVYARSWTALRLYEKDETFESAWIILDTYESVSYRVGLIRDIPLGPLGPGYNMNDLPSMTREIRLE